jgi:protein KRI1
VKAKYGSDFEEGDLEESTESESAESEDEEGEELTPAVDAAILRTLARIRKKDPAIYDSGKNIFGGKCQHLTMVVRVLRAGCRGGAESVDGDSPCKEAEEG